MTESKRVQKFFKMPSRTRPEFKAQCDLGLTIKRFAKTPEGRDALSKAKGTIGGVYQDLTSLLDFRAAKQAVLQASESFMRLPAVVRRRFNNDAATFLDFCRDPKNLDELRSLGLAKPATVENPVKGGSPVPPAG